MRTPLDVMVHCDRQRDAVVGQVAAGVRCDEILMCSVRAPRDGAASAALGSEWCGSCSWPTRLRGIVVQCVHERALLPATTDSEPPLLFSPHALLPGMRNTRTPVHLQFGSTAECNEHICNCWSATPTLGGCTGIVAELSKRGLDTSDRSCAVKVRLPDAVWPGPVLLYRLRPARPDADARRCRLVCF